MTVAAAVSLLVYFIVRLSALADSPDTQTARAETTVELRDLGQVPIDGSNNLFFLQGMDIHADLVDITPEQMSDKLVPVLLVVDKSTDEDGETRELQLPMTTPTCTREMFEKLGGGKYFDRLTQFGTVGANSLLCFDLNDADSWLLANQLDTESHRII